MSRLTKTIWTVLIAASLLYQLGIAFLIAGHDAMEYGALDGQGRRFGFNDPITLGHMEMMLSKVTIEGLLNRVGWYSGCGLIAHLIGLVLIWTSRIRRGARQLFFVLQTVLFPLGWFPLSWMAFMAQFIGPIDGESIQDGPISVGISQVSWWLATIVIFLWDLVEEDVGKRAFVLQRNAL